MFKKNVSNMRTHLGYLSSDWSGVHAKALAILGVELYVLYYGTLKNSELTQQTPFEQKCS